MLSILAYIFVTTAVILSTLSYFFENRELKKRVAHFPGPKSYPLIGSAYVFYGDPRYVLNRITNIFTTYPSPFKLEVGPKIYIGTSDPKQIKNILMSPKALEKDDFYRFSQSWVGNGLLTAPASIWRVHRKLIQPAFNIKVLESFVEVFQKQATIMANEMSAEVDGKEFKTIHYLSSCTLNVICESAMGVSIISEEEKKKGYLEESERAIIALSQRGFKVWLHPDIFFNLTKTSKMYYKSVAYLQSITNYIIRRRRSEIEKESVTSTFLGQRKPFLDLLLELSDNEKKLSNEEIREEVDTMLFGGHDTTATIISFVLLMLALHPDIQAKAYDEIYNNFGSDDPEVSPLDYKDLLKLEYLERVIKETLRLFPVSPILLRKITEDLNIGAYTIPKGCSAALSIFVLHRDEKYWPNPLKFDPDRFLPEEVDKRHPFSFIPFSGGPRNCIGLLFAMMSMKVILTTILRKYVIKTDNIVPVKDIKLKILVLLKPVKPLAIRIEKRVQ
ncbi:cytochrome P450 4C1-like isoform X2 [Belonocnema kinseyi]|uniref:cytochrome P450 4C1-like isoform X2 n=1 Tax=Belonocnema kinseyi TaxID=2817044 RepID=UPI00143D118A|nr:cytochrome P450 4C1-like isoform X2 [Belonocnema kinseyi]